MKLKFNEYGWIKCFEMVNDGQGKHFIWRRFDTKAAALRWVRENPEMRAVCAECLQLPAPAKPEFPPADRRSDDDT